MSWEIRQADCIEAMRELDESSIDAVVCDPPYGLEFMGKEWDRLGYDWESSIGKTGYTDADRMPRPSFGSTRNPMCRACHKHQRGRGRCECERPDFDQTPADANRRMQDWHHAWATEALRILKPGGHLLAFGGTRTYHRLACAVEDAGFEIRDCIQYLYGSGFPKSLSVDKAIDKAAGAEREVVGTYTMPADSTAPGYEASGEAGYDGGHGIDRSVTAPATPEAEQWQGWGTALKPAHEPIVVARKPLVGTVAQNVQETNCGALNIDACRVEGPPRTTHTDGHRSTGSGEGYGMDAYEAEVPSGRWPPNVVLDEESARLLDEQTGDRPSGIAVTRHGGGRRIFNQPSDGKSEPDSGYTDSGGASRFFYTAKASRSERNAGLEGFEERQIRRLSGGDFAHNSGSTNSDKAGASAQNSHPTVKPIALMRWLCRLVTPPNGLILDPFTGSGTTGCAAVLEGFDFLGIEREAEYVEIAKARVAHWASQPQQLGLEAA